MALNGIEWHWMTLNDSFPSSPSHPLTPLTPTTSFLSWLSNGPSRFEQSEGKKKDRHLKPKVLENKLGDSNQTRLRWYRLIYYRICVAVMAILRCTEDNSATPPQTVRPRLRVQKKDLRRGLFCTRSRGRTGTAITGHRILSPACLPIPPFEQPFAHRWAWQK